MKTTDVNHLHTYSSPAVFFSSAMLFSGTLPPPNHFFVAENRDLLNPFLDTNYAERETWRGLML